MEKIRNLMMTIINEQGIDYLQRKPYEVYERLM